VRLSCAIADSAEPGDGLLAVLPLGALAAMVVNDHVLKPALGNAFTGKLSDFAGLAFFPLVLQAGYELIEARSGRPFSPRAPVLYVAVVLTGLVFALAKLTAAGAAACAWAIGALQWPLWALLHADSGGCALRPVAFVRDATDLFALPALALALVAGLGRIRSAG